ncbi:hypothetical protein GCM10011529_13650 [Polymorphobacter glacialis]|uniref:DUF4174 domain-containing protein n=2 Tax=Sandarakinorhabdus glacialis TaxID=1614636 RepID=A0A916ZQ50_9SPHN|nr:hypothetical protein GCM10011529_13650 [Polymorphobacter glacialis]
MRWQHRVLLVSAPDDDDPELVRQRGIFAAMQAAAGERDLVMVTVVGDVVGGAWDAATTLRRRHRLDGDRFVAVLIGKDGGEKSRSGTAVTAGELVADIDAMPMRRGGER